VGYKVVMTDNIFPNLDIEKKALEEIGATLVERQCTNAEEIIDEVRDADALLNVYSLIGENVINAMEKCKIIARYGIGVDNVDCEAAKKKGIKITNVPDYCIDEVSDHALALLMATARKIPQLYDVARQGVWDYKEHRPIYRLKDQTLGFLGFGKIARMLKEKTAPLGFKFLAYDPYVKEAGPDVDMVDIEDIFKHSDYISVHVPLNNETKGLVNEDLFKLMKPNAIIINTARGPIINEEHLVEALRKQQLGGAALDVLSQETTAFSKDHPLLQFENVLITPHVAFYSEESVDDQQTKAVKQIVKTFKGEELDYLVIG